MFKRGFPINNFEAALRQAF